jgi:hypothetical protein
MPILNGALPTNAAVTPAQRHLRPGIGAAHQSNNENNYIVFYL